MKRKKQNEGEEHFDDLEPSLKKTRSDSRPEDDRRYESGDTHLDGRDSREEYSIAETIHEPVLPYNELADPDLAGDGAQREESQNGQYDTPRRGRGRPPINRDSEGQSKSTPQKPLQAGKRLFSTPVKRKGAIEENATPRIQRNADRSARRKSTRNLIERVVLGNTSDVEEEEEDLAQHIYGSEHDEGADELEGNISEVASVPATPSKRGRPKGSKNKRRPPTPPLLGEQIPHEKYFSHNRGGRAKTSNNNLSSLELLDHEEFFSLSRKIKDRHKDNIEFLQGLHEKSFNQWKFELGQDFNICVYGWGSKRSLLMRLADYIYVSETDRSLNKIVVVNGYVPTLTIRDVLSTVAAAVSEPGHKLGSQPSEMLENLLALLEEDKAQHITLIIHSIDSATLRRPATQSILSRLSSHPQIHLVASADHPSFPLLWDSSLRSMYNFLFHDCTTFQLHNAEVDVVDEVHELLGRSGRRVGGKEGVSFVLESLPENAKNLFRVLIGEQLAAMDDSGGAVYDGFDDNDEDEDNEPRSGLTRKGEVGVEYRVLYQKAVEEFICSNEMNFRTLLKEFHDHQMIQSRKDTLGTEMLSVPFRKEELETILEDISL